MPLYLWRFSVVGIPVNFLEMMIYILFGLWFFRQIKKKLYLALANNFHNLGHRDKNNLILFVGIILLFLGLSISTIISSDIRTSLGIFKGWFLSPFLFFIVLISVCQKRKDITQALKSWLASGVVVSLIGILYLLNGNITFDGRLKAFFLSPNHLAMYLAPVFLIMLNFFFQETSCAIKTSTSSEKTLFSSKKNKVIFLLIITIPLFFTYSYGALLGIFAGVLYLIIKNRDLKVRKTFRCFFVLIFILFFGFLSFNKLNQVTNSENRSSFHSRLMIWKTAGEIIQDNPFVGIGPGTFQETYLSYANEFREPYLEWAVPQPHNIFLAFYLQTGFLGFLGFVLILIWFFINSDMSGGAFKRTYIIKALMIYILVHGLVDTTYWKNDLSLMFWIIIGLAVLSSRNISQSGGKKESF